MFLFQTKVDLNATFLLIFIGFVLWWYVEVIIYIINTLIIPSSLSLWLNLTCNFAESWQLFCWWFGSFITFGVELQIYDSTWASSACVSESGEQKKAVVQWFCRVSEVPPSKLKLLGREPHPQEIFHYQARSCDDEVDAESILRPVQVNKWLLKFLFFKKLYNVYLNIWSGTQGPLDYVPGSDTRWHNSE